MASAKASSVDGAKELFKFVKRGDVERVRALVTAEPALVHARDAEGSTPLHHAAWKGHAEVATLLLGAGADVNAQSRNTHYGGTPSTPPTATRRPWRRSSSPAARTSTP